VSATYHCLDIVDDIIEILIACMGILFQFDGASLDLGLMGRNALVILLVGKKPPARAKKAFRSALFVDRKACGASGNDAATHFTGIGQLCVMRFVIWI